MFGHQIEVYEFSVQCVTISEEPTQSFGGLFPALFDVAAAAVAVARARVYLVCGSV